MTALLLALLAAAPAPPTLHLQDAAAVPGGLLVLDVDGVDGPARLHGALLGQKLRFFRAGPHHQRALVGLSLDQQPGKVEVQVELRHGKESQTLQSAVELRPKEFRKSVLKVSPKFVTPPRSARKQIAEDHKAIAEAYKSFPFAPATFVGKLSLPRDSEITAHFGDQRIYNGKLQSAHKGTDFDGKIGEPIRAIADGVVVMARPCYYSGNTVFVAHGAGLFSQYFHMTRMDVHPGQVVHRGQQLGIVGKTGRVTGPHLHLGLKVFSRLVDAEEAFKLDLGLDPGQKPEFPQIAAGTGGEELPDGGYLDPAEPGEPEVGELDAGAP